MRSLFCALLTMGALASCSLGASVCDVDLTKAAEAEETLRFRGHFLVDVHHGSVIVGEKCPTYGAPVEEFDDAIAPEFSRLAFEGGGWRSYEVDVTATVVQGDASDARPRLRIIAIHSFQQLPLAPN